MSAPNSRRRFIEIGLSAVLAGAVSGVAGYLVASQPSMQSMTSTSATPPVRAFYKGQEIQFIHTEASDQSAADMLTRMMGARVLVVPSLAELPRSALGNVFAFTNGVKGGGPFGFQLDVFASVPGDSDYTPLRYLNLVAWNPIANPREAKSTEEIKAAESAGEVTIRQPGVVVNMPIISWPGGHR